jgi:hypothetical protein
LHTEDLQDVVPVADNLSNDILAYNTRPLTSQASLAIESYGTAGLGVDLTDEAWPHCRQEFAIGEGITKNCPDRPPCFTGPSVHRVKQTFLEEHPVDLLVLGNLDTKTAQAWRERVPRTTEGAPRFILEFWDPHWITHESGPMSKASLTPWTKLGYRSSCKTVNALQVGGVVDRHWLIVARVKNLYWKNWSWPEFPPEVVRPMNKCLRPTGVPASAYKAASNMRASDAPNSDSDAMPWIPGSFITTRQGTRRLMNDEIAKGLGVPKLWFWRFPEEHYPDGKIIGQTVALHILEALSPIFLQSEPGETSDPIDDALAGAGHTTLNNQQPSTNQECKFDWKPPNLSPKSEWSRRCATDLIQACLQYDDPVPTMIEDGMKMMRNHRSNYNADGPDPRTLQLL